MYKIFLLSSLLQPDRYFRNSETLGNFGEFTFAFRRSPHPRYLTLVLDICRIITLQFVNQRRIFPCRDERLFILTNEHK